MHLKIKALASLAAATLITMNIGCSGGGSGASGSTGAPLKISGGFSSISLASLKPVNGLFTPMAATDYTMVCSMLVDPFSSDSKALDSSGKFSLSIAGAAGKPIGCFLTKSGKIAAVVEFTAASSGFSGAAGGSAFNPNGDSTSLTLPTTLSISNGVVAVNTSAIVQDGTTAPTTTWADPTGAWNITGACQNGFDKTSGTYKSECQGAAGGQGDIPTSVYLKQIGATNGSNSKTGLSIWASSAARVACGNVEGPVTLESGWSATGGWNAAFTGTGSFDVSSTGAVATASSLAIAQTFGGNQTVCNATVATPGTTKCSAVDFTGKGTGWGMSDNACKLYCVLMAIQNNRPDEGQNNYDFGGATCPLRYRMNHQYSNELSNDKDFNGSNNPGAFNGGSCAVGVNKCAHTGNTLTFLEPDGRGPASRFMFGELFISSNVGTLVQKEHFSHNFSNQAMTGSITCGGSHIEKFTMVQESATKATVTVEHSFVPDLTNHTECATNTNFMQMSDNESTMTLKVSKQ